MHKNTYEKSLVKVNIFSRIKLFFRKLFKNSTLEEGIITENVIEEKNSLVKENNFINNIKLSEKKLNLRLQKMSKDLESGKIIEEDLCEQELQELREFYQQQIEEKKDLIENYKKRIIKIKSQLV